MNKKKYILKPGRHQFAPAGGAGHHNGLMTDEEAEWYLQHYPHIAQLFISDSPKVDIPEVPSSSLITDKKIKKVKPVIPASGSKEAS